MEEGFPECAKTTLSPPAFYCTIALFVQVKTFRLGGCFSDKKAKISLFPPLLMGVLPQLPVCICAHFHCFDTGPPTSSPKKRKQGPQRSGCAAEPPVFFSVLKAWHERRGVTNYGGSTIFLPPSDNGYHKRDVRPAKVKGSNEPFGEMRCNVCGHSGIWCVA